MSEKLFIIVDLKTRLYAAPRGWVSQKAYAKTYTEEEVHGVLKHLRKKDFKDVTFEEAADHADIDLVNKSQQTKVSA